MSYPVWKETTRVIKYPYGCRIYEELTDFSISLPPQAGYILSLCTGYADKQLLQKCVMLTYNLSEQEAGENVEKTLRLCEKCLEWKKHPQNRSMPYQPEDFIFSAEPYNPLKRLPFPAEATLTLTNVCNFRCVYCYNGSGEKKVHKELTTEQWLQAVSQLLAMGTIKFTMTGGEPLLYPGFWEIYKQLSEHHALITICSNGSLLDDEDIGRLIQYGQHTIQISLDTADSNQNDRLTMCKGMFPEVVKNIGKLCKAGLQVTVKALMIPETISGVFDLMQLCHELGVKKLVLDTYDFCYGGRGDKRFFLDRETAGIWKKQIEKRAEAYGETMKVYFVLPKTRWETCDDIVRCGAFLSGISILPNGEFTLCEKTCGISELCVGYFPKMSVPEAWNSEKIAAILNPPKEKIEKPCKSCEYLERCHTGCFAVKQFVTDSVYAADPRCFQAEYKNNPFTLSDEVGG